MSNELEHLTHRILALNAENQTQEAIPLLQKAIELAPKDPSLHNHLANLYKKTSAFSDAEKHYQTALKLNPNYPEAHHNLANLYAQQQEFNKALNHYSEALHWAPDYTLAHYHLGLLFLAYQKKEPAQTQFKNVIELCPDFYKAHFYLGVLAMDKQDFTEATLAFEQVLLLHPHDPDTHVNLGVLALKEEQAQKAIHHFTEALSYDEHHVDARHNLAATFIHHDRYENALTHYTFLLAIDPYHQEYLYNAGVAEMALGHLEKAKLHFKTLLKKSPKHFATLMNLSAISARLNKSDEARQFLKLAHQENPDDPSCKHMLDALEGKTDSQTCPEYAKNLFDNYALYYDLHLQQTLNYHLPHTVSRLIHKLIPSYNSQNTLDLGCGTGLSGVSLREISQHLTGVDLSVKMIHEADKKGIYDTLITGELVEFLSHSTVQYDLILSVDVLPYLGDLAPLFSALSPRLRTEGLFIFNVEISETLPFQLQHTARFSHHSTYIHALAEEHGLDIVHENTTVSRQQDGQDLSVLLFALQKGAS